MVNHNDKKKKVDLTKEIGRKIWKVRKALGYTQTELVSYFDIGRANYSRIENGEVWPNPTVLHTLRTKFDVSLDWLIADIGKMFIRETESFSAGENTGKGNIEYREEILELLSYMKNVPMVKHAVLGFFLEYKLKYDEIIQKSLKENQPIRRHEETKME